MDILMPIIYIIIFMNLIVQDVSMSDVPSTTTATSKNYIQNDKSTKTNEKNQDVKLLAVITITVLCTLASAILLYCVHCLHCWASYKLSFSKGAKTIQPNITIQDNSDRISADLYEMMDMSHRWKLF
ncbi:uncharacterized protein [Linepithema humile]|uniref:uncharacterized protein n=1 Tax=Linepithema humile TaxID=83485 RepID=UPI00351E6BE0